MVKKGKFDSDPQTKNLCVGPVWGNLSDGAGSPKCLMGLPLALRMMVWRLPRVWWPSVPQWERRNQRRPGSSSALAPGRMTRGDSMDSGGSGEGLAGEYGGNSPFLQQGAGFPEAETAEIQGKYLPMAMGHWYMVGFPTKSRLHAHPA